MSNCSLCDNFKPGLPCGFRQEFKTECLIREVPLQGQVFGLPSPSKYPPFHRRKLSDKEVREAIDRHELWPYVPPWQVPRIGTKQFGTRFDHLSDRNMPMMKIVCMAKRNKTQDGNIGRLKFDFPHFGKRKLKKP